MKNYKRGRFARRILFGIVILIGIVYLNRVSILQKIVALGSQSQLINIDK
ncbi:DNA-entry nuclease, partial [Leuconostoc suionicum]|nr:DNA-entry nuclease [Leuconostoc suionicum]